MRIKGTEWFRSRVDKAKRRKKMYAVEFTNLNNGNKHYTQCRDFEHACDTLRWEVQEMKYADWVEDEDFTAKVTEVDDDFDFDNQPEWN